jgi:integrase/recombinase XerD
MWQPLAVELIESERVRGLAERSRKELDTQLRFFCAYAEESGGTLEGVSPVFLRDYCVERGQGRGYSTVKSAVWSVKQFFGWLALAGRRSDNPAQALRYPRSRTRTTLPVFLSAEELAKLLESSHAKDEYPDFALLALICSTGLRPGEISALTRFNFKPAEQLLVGRTKGGWWKQTVLNDSIVRILQTHLAARSDTESALFVAPRGSSVSPGYIRLRVAAAGQRIGLGFRLTCNILRHTFATHAARRHGRTVTRALLGHRSETTTAIYTHLSTIRFKPLLNRHPYPLQGRSS